MDTLKDELLNLAFQLAYFIHPDKELAKRIVVAALEKVETAALAQDKRLYYPGRRRKVSMTELHLLQRLVYGESESYEKQRESSAATPPSEETLLIHFIKHLVRITVRRNSLYVTLGLSRLLHQYTTAEAQELYSLVVQNPNRVPGEDYFRARKKNLMEDLKKRFGTWLTTTRGVRGEERFATHHQPERFAALVCDCLAAFTPWRTYCCVPAGFAPTSDTLAALVFSGADPDAEHDIEINRFHAVLHPDCFAKLIRGLGYATPAERLEIPHFAHANRQDEDDALPPNPRAASLDESERAAIHGQLSDKAGRRKNLTSGLLHFVVAGAEIAQLDLRRATQTSFTLPEDAEFLEVRARDAAGEVVLATHALLYDDDDLPRAQQTALVLEGGQQLSFQISLARDSFGNVTGTAATVSYRETRPLRALRLWWRRQTVPVVAAPVTLVPLRLLLPVSLVLLATTATLATLWYRERQANQHNAALIAQAQNAQQELAEKLKTLADTSATQSAAERARRQADTEQLNQLKAQVAEARQAQQNIFAARPVRLAEVRSSAESEVREIPASVKAFTLPLAFNSPGGFRAYTLEVYDSRGKLIEQIPNLDPTSTGGLLFPTLQRKGFKTGAYQLRLYGQQGQALKLLGKYDLKLSFN